jgi:hypothetical protein
VLHRIGDSSAILAEGKRFVVPDEKLTALLEMQSAIRDASGRPQSAICVVNVELSLLSNPVLAAQFAPQRTHCQQR